MRILKLPLIILPLILFLICFFLANPVAVSAGELNPTFDVTVLDSKPGTSSDMEFRLTNPIGSEVSPSTKLNVPSGWDISAGNNFPDGTIMGSGSFTANFGSVLTFHFLVKNSTDLQGHIAHLVVEFTDSPIPVSIDNFIDGNSKDGYVFTLNPVPAGIEISLPTETLFTLKGAPDTINFITTSKNQGDYSWSAGFLSPTLGADVIRSKTINIPSTKTPIGMDVNVAFANGAQITFASVSVDGLTTLVTQAQVPAAGIGQFQVVEDGLYYSFSTTATIACPCTVSLPYDAETNSKPGVVHLNTKADPAVWNDVTTKVDEANSVVVGSTEDF